MIVKINFGVIKIKKVLSVILVLMMLLALTACDDDSSASPTPTTGTTQSTTNVTTSAEKATTKPSNTTTTTAKATTKVTTTTTTIQQTTAISLTEAEQIAETLILKYHQYSYLTVCCDTVYNDDYTVCKIACCHSIKEMNEHTLKYLDKSIANKFTSDYFSDDKNGNIYVVIDGHGILGYGDVSILEYSSKKIVAKVPIVDIDGPTGAYDVFCIEKKGNDFIVTSINK